LNGKIKVLLTFVLRFRAVIPTSKVNCADITRVKPEQPAYEIFSIKRRFQQCKSRTPLQGNLPTLLQYRTFLGFLCTAFLIFILLLLFLFARIFHRVLPESGGGWAADPFAPGSSAHDSATVKQTMH